jgi:DNA-binding NarL/FixJ family response regulator
MSFLREQFSDAKHGRRLTLVEGEPLKILASVRILIVEDSQRWRRAIRSILEESPHLVVICECSDGLEAIRKSEQLQPDLVVLDIGLPKVNGLEAARHIRMVAPRSKILFLTAYTSADLLSEAIQTGALGYVVKPDAGGELLSAVNAVMRDQRFISSRVIGSEPDHTS